MARRPPGLPRPDPKPRPHRLGAFASLVVAVAILGSSLYLFIGVGFFSFINGVLFAFVVAIGLEVAYSKAPFTHQLGEY